MRPPGSRQQPVPQPTPARKPSRDLTVFDKFQALFKISDLVGFSVRPNNRVPNGKQILLQVGKTTFTGLALEEVILLAFDRLQPRCPKCGSQTYIELFGAHNGTTFTPHSCNDCGHAEFEKMEEAEPEPEPEPEPEAQTKMEPAS